MRTGHDGHVPAGLIAAAVALAIEAVGLVIAAGFAVAATLGGQAASLGGGVAIAVIAALVAVGLAAMARGAGSARPWSRTPAVMAQLLALITAVYLFEGHHPEWAIPLVVLAVVVLAGMFYPAGLAALNRGPRD